MDVWLSSLTGVSRRDGNQLLQQTFPEEGLILIRRGFGEAQPDRVDNLGGGA
jgi:hypothetical protein